MHKTDQFALSGFRRDIERDGPRSSALRRPCDTQDRSALLPMWPHELGDMSLAGRRTRIAVLRRTLRAERQRGVSGHWTYDLARHWALLRWYRTEVAELEGPDPTQRSGHWRAHYGCRGSIWRIPVIQPRVADYRCQTAEALSSAGRRAQAAGFARRPHWGLVRSRGLPGPATTRDPNG